jgi:DnaJ family protein C protein 28
MTPSERERSQRREELRRAWRKLEERQITAQENKSNGRPRGEREWRDRVEQRIQEAMAAGVFDNLPGAGQPLNLIRNPYLDPSLELAYGLLKNNGYTPEWIARDKEIREELEAARARLRAAWAQHQARPADETAWGAALAHFEETITRLNRKIDDFNLMVPVSCCQRVRVRLADELRRLNYE